MPLSLLADSADSGSMAYQAGEFIGPVVLVAVIVAVVLAAYRRRQSEQRAAQAKQEQDQQQYQAWQNIQTRPVPGRTTYDDGRVEEFQLPLGQLPDVVLRFQQAPGATIELRDPSKGTIRVYVGAGFATVDWDSLAGSFRHRASTPGPDGRYRMSVAEAAGVVHAWTSNATESSSWERAAPASARPSSPPSPTAQSTEESDKSSVDS